MNKKHFQNNYKFDKNDLLNEVNIIYNKCEYYKNLIYNIEEIIFNSKKTPLNIGNLKKNLEQYFIIYKDLTYIYNYKSNLYYSLFH